MLSGRLPRKSLVRRSLVRQSLGVPRFAETPSGGTASITVGAVTLSGAGSVTAGATIPTWVANGTVVEGTGGITVAWPVGNHQADDIGLLLIETAGEAVTFSNARGFVAVTDSPQTSAGAAGGTAATQLNMYWCRATSGTMLSPVTDDPGNHAIGVIMVFRGCITTGDPWNVTAGAATGAQGTTFSVPGDTTTVDGCLVVAATTTATDIATTEIGGWTNASLSDLTQQLNYQTSTPGNGGGIGAACGGKATAGAYDATTGTLVTSAHSACISIALKPPA